MKVLIIEDEAIAAKKLIRLLTEFDKDIVILDVLESVESATNWLLNNLHPELIFMDVQLEDGICFEIFENVAVKSPVIFTTAYDEYALRAFKVNSVDYILKPINSGDLIEAIQKYKLVYQKSFDFNKIEAIIGQLNPQKKERFLIKVGEHYRSFQTTDINCFFIEDKCSFINVVGGRNFAIDYSLDKVEEMVDSTLFFRVNRNLIINYGAIQDVVIYSSSRLKVALNNWNEKEDILVSRDRVSDFKKWMDR